MLDELDEEDGGEYLCVGENSAGRIQTNFTLNTGISLYIYKVVISVRLSVCLFFRS